MKIIAKINPRLLSWARNESKLPLENILKTLKVEEEVFYSWEKGETFPTMSQLKKLGKLFYRPTALFYLNSPPEDKPLKIKDYRRFHISEDVSPELSEFVRKVQERIEYYCEYTDPAQSIISKLGPVKISDDIPNLAKELRKNLGIDFKQQRKWKDQYVALKNWSKAVESLGVLVFQTSNISIEEMRGFALNLDIPVIALNAKDDPRARLFTLIHELGHILLKDEGLVISDIDTFGNISKEEVFCNKLSIETIAPREDFLKNPLIEYLKRENIEPDDEFLKQIGSEFNLSKHALLIRLYELKVIKKSFFDIKIEDLQTGVKGGSGRSKVVVTYYTKMARNLGGKYPNELFKSYRRDKINTYELSNALGIKSKLLQKFETHVIKRASQ